MKLKTLNDFCYTINNSFTLAELKAEAINIFNDSMSVEEFGKKMVRFFEIQKEENLK